MRTLPAARGVGNININHAGPERAHRSRNCRPLFSDTRKVGYALPWVRPPSEVYSLLPITASDGGGFSYRLNFGDVTNTTQGSYVQSNTPQPDNRVPAIARDSINFSNTTQYQSLTFRVSYQHALLTIAALDGLFDTFRTFGPEGIAIADRYNSDGKPVVTEVIGASYDPGRWFLIGEWAHARLNSFLGENTAWYLSNGLRLGRFTPYVTYAHETAASNFDPGLPLTGLPPALANFAAGLNATLTPSVNRYPTRSTVSGMRFGLCKEC